MSKHAARPRIHIFCATSKIHREHKLRKGKEEIIRISVEAIQQARQYTADIEFSKALRYHICLSDRLAFTKRSLMLGWFA